MPYLMVANGDNFDVYKADADGKQTGKALNKKPMPKAMAGNYMSSLTAKEGKSLTEAELVALEEKCYSEDSYVNKLSPDDPRAAYDAMGGRSGDMACANCRWFHPGSASCDLIWGEKVASGVSKLWLSNEVAQPAPDAQPMPVYIVEPVDAGEMSKPAKKSLLDQFLEYVGIKSNPIEDTRAGFKVYPDGRWVGWYTNNAKDLVKENFSAKSIDAYIARVDDRAVPYPELWHKHLPFRMGKADALARIGYLTLSTGKFYDTPVGQRGKAYYEAEQKAGRPKTMSHGFLYPTNLKSNGVYNAFNTFEITVLDPGEEANPYTNFEVKDMFNKVSEDSKKFEELVKIFGKDEVEKLINFGETKSKELEATPGVDLKSFSSFDGVAVEDKEAHAQIKALAEATAEGLKRIGDRLDTITASIATADEKATAQASASAKSIADLRAYVDEQFGYAPRASKAAETQLAKDNAQVAQLAKANATAGKNTAEPASSALVPETKSIFDYMVDASKAPNR